MRFNTGWTTFEQIEGMAAVLRKYSPPRPPEGPLGGDTFPVSYPEDPEEARSFARGRDWLFVRRATTRQAVLRALQKPASRSGTW